MKIRHFPLARVETFRTLLLLPLALAFPLAHAQTSNPPEKITLRLQVWDGDEALKAQRRVIARFEKEHPNIHVKLENFGDYNLYHQKQLTQYAANVAPDVAMEDMPHFQALAKRKAFLPLNQFFATTPGFDIKEYYKPIVEAHSWNGEVYVLPRDIAPEGLIYFNKRAFDEAGIPYPDGSWTWDFQERPELKEKDFLWVCHQLTKFDKNGKPTRWAIASGWPELLATTFAMSSGHLQGDNVEHPTKVLVGDPGYIKAYQFASDFMNKLKYMPNSTETSGVMMKTTQQLFSSEKIAMYQNGIWEVPNMRKEIIPGKKSFFEWDITLFPAYKDGHRAWPTGGSGYAIYKTTRYPKESWELVRYLAGPVGMTELARAGIAQPAIAKLARTPDVWVPGPNTPIEQRYPANRLATDQAVAFVKFAPTADYWPEVGDRLSAGLDLLWSGQSTANVVIKRSQINAQNRLDTLLKEEKLPPYNWNVGITAGLLIVAVILGWTYFPERKKKYTNREKQESRAAYKFASPWLIGAIVFTIGPMIFSLLMSFANWDIITPARWRGFGNYREAGVVDPLFWKSMLVTTIYTGVSVPLGVFGSLLLALLLNVKVRGVQIYRSLFYMPSLASMVAASLIWRRVFNPENGLINSIIYGADGSWLGSRLSAVAGTPHAHVDWLGNEKFALPAMIIMSLWGVGGGMIILLAGLQSIPNFYYEAATLDGAGTMAKFRNVTLPLLTPTLFFSTITGFIGSFQSFTQALVMTSGGPNDTTRFYMLHLYRAAFESLRMGYASALAWVLFFVILIVTLIQVKGGERWVYYEAGTK